MSEIMLVEPLKGLEKSKAAQIESVFVPMVKMLKEFEAAYEDVMTTDMNEETCATAKRLRLDIAKIRIAADKERKALKEEYLRGGNAVQAVYNLLKFAVVEKEEKLKERETYYERQAEQRIKDLQAARESELLKYETDGSLMQLGSMDVMVWDNFLAGIRTNYEAQKEAERKAEEDRQDQARKQADYDNRLKALLPYGDFFDKSKLTLDSTEGDFEQIIADAKFGRAAHLAEQERIRKENERLQKEAEAAEKKREREEKARKAREKKEQEAREAEQRAKDEELRREREAREAAEEKARQQKEEQARKDAEAEAARKAEAEAAADAERKAALAPDKEKLETVAGNILAKLDMFSSDEAKSAMEEAAAILTAAAGKM